MPRYAHMYACANGHEIRGKIDAQQYPGHDEQRRPHLYPYGASEGEPCAEEIVREVRTVLLFGEA